MASEAEQQEFAVQQFIDLCNNLCATAAAAGTLTASTSTLSAASASVSASSTASASGTQPPLAFTAPPTEAATAGAIAGGGEGPVPIFRRNISHTTAVKFLYARKFDIPRAVSLYEQHEQIRQKEYLYNIDPDVEPLRSELQTGKFTILPARTSSGAAIALFTANRHSPLSVGHTTTLQGIVYQLDSALQDTETQRAGLVFIYDMSGSKYSNFDYDLSQKILTLLKGGYPARLKKVLIVTAPLWFKAPFKILRLFVREKLRERVFTVSVPQLGLHVPRKALPLHLGGTLEIDHATWLLSCRQSMTNREDELLANITVGTVTGVTGVAGVTGVTGVPGAAAVAATTNGSSSGSGSGTGSGTAAAAAAATIISAVHQLADNNTTVVTVSNGEASNDATATSGGSIEPNENITINGLSPSHRGSGSAATGGGGSAAPGSGGGTSPLKLNTSGVPLDGGGIPKAATIGLGAPTATGPGAGTVAGLAVRATGGGPGAEATNGGEFWSENPPSSASSGFSDDDSLAGQEGDPKPIEQIVQMVMQRGRHGLVKEYTDIRNRTPDGTFLHARMRANLTKNRYTDVLCFDHSRVVLAQEDGVEELSDYINANFVDGYKQKNAYISTQGAEKSPKRDPIPQTRNEGMGREGEGREGKGTVPLSKKLSMFSFLMRYSIGHNRQGLSIDISILQTDEIAMSHIGSSPAGQDYGVPSSAMAVLNFLQKVRDKQAELVEALGDTWAGHARGPPIVVHCSAGIGRTGTFITLDICISRLEDVGTADIRGTVEKIRSQRAYSIQMPDQYVFCHLALIEYAYSRGMLQTVDLAGFDEREPDSE
ncbi:GL16614 [Drosophila persimilis]|uniref:GL16614 n=1 Tax=Drosophila persimilis TaxID=7234 RepID=B4GWU0_DROPE|nr:GL16614 [Drosophila persimilis]